MLPVQPNRSLIDGIACLQALAVHPAPVGVRGLARQLGQEPTRVHRLLKTLAHLGFTRQAPDRKYEPGPAMHVLSAQSLFASGLVRRALAPLEALHAYGWIVALGVLWRENVCYLYHALPGMSVGEALGRMGLYPATRSSIGMVLLARTSEETVRDIYRGMEIPGYPGGLGFLLKDLRRIRAAGFARVVQNRSPLNASVAVPVGDPPDAAIAFAGSIRAGTVAGLVPILRRTALEILAATPVGPPAAPRSS
jgi:DNA-binding IclR family transcriptional regulator